jgi:threonine dehydrogenase-like Zn-dependent dehydrogenase
MNAGVYCKLAIGAKEQKPASALLAWRKGHSLRQRSGPGDRASRNAIVNVSSCAICGSDLHLSDGFMPGTENGDIMGHEFMGEVVEIGPKTGS